MTQVNGGHLRKLNLLTFAVIVAIALSGCSQGGTVPDLIGKTSIEGKLELADKGIQFETTERASKESEEGSILETVPRAGERVSGPVEVIVGSGQDYEKPDIDFEAEIEPTWWPSGFVRFDKDIAYRWATSEFSGDACGYGACSYWVLEVTSRFGCPSGVYGEIDILRNDVVLDWTNDSLASLRADQKGQLVFTKRNLGSGSHSAQLAELNCR